MRRTIYAKGRSGRVNLEIALGADDAQAFAADDEVSRIAVEEADSRLTVDFGDSSYFTGHVFVVAQHGDNWQVEGGEDVCQQSSVFGRATVYEVARQQQEVGCIAHSGKAALDGVGMAGLEV